MDRVGKIYHHIDDTGEHVYGKVVQEENFHGKKYPIILDQHGRHRILFGMFFEATPLIAGLFLLYSTKEIYEIFKTVKNQ